ncbi:tyrosine-type recombinase/integrase (plasmid) [Rhodococcus sp. 21391]|nr:tyrosine-type recombinase/integrase [Rhodococcus sp. 21391]
MRRSIRRLCVPSPCPGRRHSDECPIRSRSRLSTAAQPLGPRSGRIPSPASSIRRLSRRHRGSHRHRRGSSGLGIRTRCRSDDQRGGQADDHRPRLCPTYGRNRSANPDPSGRSHRVSQALAPTVHFRARRYRRTHGRGAGFAVAVACGDPLDADRAARGNRHVLRDHPCGERSGPHAHLVKRINPNRAAAKRGFPATVMDGIITGGIVRRASPAMVDSYHEYLAEDYHRVRALADSDLVLVQLAGQRAGAGLSTHGARQMIDRAGRRAGLGRVRPHTFRHTWATALTEATGGNTKAVADEGGWTSSRTVEDTYAHLAGDPTLQAALEHIWTEQL